jgi:hypothetical protein
MISLKTNAMLVFVAGLTALGGCGMLKKKQPDPAASAAAPIAAAPVVAAPATAVPTPAPEATVADEAIAAPEDFEDEAFAKVSDKTYKTELDGLKKDIEAK